MKGKIIQIVVVPETSTLRNALYALTDAGEIYFLVLSEGRWYHQELPSGKIKKQGNATDVIEEA